MEKIQFLKSVINDLKAIQKIGYKTFKDSFGTQNTEENMASYLSMAFSEAKIKEGLKNKNSLFYLIKLAENTIGYFKLNIEDAQTEVIEKGLEIERIYLLSTYQNRGTGQLMLNKIFEISDTLGKDKIWLGVWNKNKEAIRFYERNGFRRFGEHSFFLGTDKQMDILMEFSVNS